MRVVNHKLLLIRNVSRFCTKCEFIERRQSHFREPPSFSWTDTHARSKSHNGPDTECVPILYKCQFSVSNSHKRTCQRCVPLFLVPVTSLTFFQSAHSMVHAVFTGIAHTNPPCASLTTTAWGFRQLVNGFIDDCFYYL